MSRTVQDRVSKGTTLAPDAVTCPVCLEPFNCITAGHFRKHGYGTAAEFKQAFGLAALKAPSVAVAHALLMATNNPMKGKTRTVEERSRMSHHRKGRGIGVAGKYDRTPEIRARISEGVTAFQLENPGHHVGHFKGQWLELDVCAPRVWVRSSWEARVLRLLDNHPDVEHVEVEPFAIPYIFEGATHHYIPDFLVHLTYGIKEVWEVKPAVFLADPQVQAKIHALNAFLKTHHMNGRIVTLSDIEGMEKTMFGEIR